MQERIYKSEEQAAAQLGSLYRRYGYTPYKMSRFEEYELYVRNKDFLLSDKIITFSDDTGRLLALKPDVTLSIVKNAPQEQGVVRKVCYKESVYRDYREILQTGLECVGDLGQYEIAEVVLLALKSLALLEGAFVLHLSHMGLVSEILDCCGFVGDEKQQAAACLRQKNSHELRQLCMRSGQSFDKLEALLNCPSSGAAALAQLEKVLTTQPEQQALEELKELWAVVEENGWQEHVRLDFSVGSDLGYYSGVVFRGYLEGIPDSVLSGGQYDKLPRKMGRRSRAIGFGVYLDLLQSRGLPENSADVDTLILHDGSAALSRITAAAEQAAKTGSVLVCTSLPKDRKWKQLITLGKEDNG